MASGSWHQDQVRHDRFPIRKSDKLTEGVAPPLSLHRGPEIQGRVRHRTLDAGQALWPAPHRRRFSRVEARRTGVHDRPASRSGTREWRAGDLALLWGRLGPLDRVCPKPRSTDWQISEDPGLPTGQFRRRGARCRAIVEG